MMSLPHVAVVCDYREENWPSMDLVGDMLVDHLHQDYSDSFSVTRISPFMRHRLTRQRPEIRGQRSEIAAKLFNADRFLNRFWDYPRLARQKKAEFDLFHVVDHSYGQLLHELPPDRTVITCHDLDTFQCLLNPAQDRRSVFFRKMMERTLNGFRQAARVTCDSVATRNELLSHKLVEPERAVVVPNGVHPCYSAKADPRADQESVRLLGEPAAGGIEILHVGSTIPRKRIDLLLNIFAAVRNKFPAARLVRVGGLFNPEQIRLVEQLDLAHSIVVLPRLEPDVLAAVYRRADIVLQPSEREAFGLPLVDALACGTPVVASDLPVLREVGGDAVLYSPVGDIAAWTETVVKLLSEKEGHSQGWRDGRAAGIAQAGKFSWAEYASKMVTLYRELL